MAHSESQWMPTYNSFTHSSRSVSLVTHLHPLVFQWRVTPTLPEELFGIFPRQLNLIKSYLHQTKDVILTSNTFRFYMQIISLNVDWSKRYSYWNFPWVLPRSYRHSSSILSGTSSSLRINTRVGTLIVATIYLQLIQNRYMFRSFTVLQCSHQHRVQTRCQRCGSCRIPLAAAVVLIVRMERSTAWRISGTVLKRMPRSGSFILGIKSKSQGLKLLWLQFDS